MAAFETFPAVEIVASFVSTIPALALTSASTIEPAVIAEAIAILAEPLKEVAVPVISPEIAIVLAVARVVAVLALPVREPVIAPDTDKVVAVTGPGVFPPSVPSNIPLEALIVLIALLINVPVRLFVAPELFRYSKEKKQLKPRGLEYR